MLNSVKVDLHGKALAETVRGLKMAERRNDQHWLLLYLPTKTPMEHPKLSPTFARLESALSPPRRAITACRRVTRYVKGKETFVRQVNAHRTNMTITAATLIAKHKAHGLAGPLIVRDLSDPKRPVRLMTFAVGKASPAVIVRKVGARPGFLERIELLERDADMRLARYVVPDMSMANADL